MIVVHLTASTFYGGPERQMLGLARHLPDDRSVFLSFAEGGRCRPFLSAVRQQGCEGVALTNDTPWLRAAAREIAGHLERVGADVLCCHGYKADLVGRSAARRRGIPVVAVSRGWTGESFRVRLYERLDRFHLRWLDRVVCVSEAQAQKVRRAGVKAGKVTVIANAVDPDRFADTDPRYRTRLLRHFRTARSRIVGAAGRLSPEKGFDLLIEAAKQLLEDDPTLGFIVFGAGPCREQLLAEVREAGLGGAFVLAGFRPDLDRFIPHLDLMVLPSFTEGMPNVVLEALAAAVPVVATAVGGTPEIIEDDVSGLLVPPGDGEALARRIGEALASEERLRELGFQGRQRVLEHFSFQTQAQRYQELFRELCPVAIATPAEALPEAEVPAAPAVQESTNELVHSSATR
jgi:glycosyltransferase involved in cell wall biosynthesis